MLHASVPLGLNGLELLLVGIALAGLAGLGRGLGWSLRGTLAAGLLLAPVLVLTAAEATQFMTTDEWGLSIYMFDPAKRELRSLSLGAFGTGLLLTLPVAHLREWWGFEPATARMLLKALWWILGLGLAAALSITLLRLRDAGARIAPLAFAAVVAGMLLLPTAQLAAKTVNYDLLSSGLGALAILLLLRYLLEQRPELGWLAFACAVLAAREKLTAGPVLLATIAILAVQPGWREPDWRSRAASACRRGAALIGAALLWWLLCLFLYSLMGPPELPPGFWWLAADPLVSWAWIPLGLLVPVLQLLDWRAAVALATILAILLAVVLLAVLGPPLAARLSRLDRRRWPAPAAFGMLLALFALGVLGAATVQGYWAPAHPTTLFGHAPIQRVNGVALHVGATSVAGHVTGIVLYALAIVTVAIPSALWAAGLLGALVSMRGGAAERRLTRTAATLIVLGLTTPIAAALAGMPFAHRYFNLNLLLLGGAILLLGVGLLGRIERTQPRLALIAAALFIVALIAETAPFRPLFAAFRPFWLEYGDPDRAEPGRLNASWMGWGEEVMRAGKALEGACLAGRLAENPPCPEVTLYAPGGLWLPGPRTIGMVNDFAEVAGELPMDARSYYVLHRLNLIATGIPMPRIEPDFTIRYRGYALAWVYRGDRLQGAGFKVRR